MEKTLVRQHQWVEFKLTPVEILNTDEGPIPIPIGKEPQITYGCLVCNMGLNEGKDISCPGRDLFEEEGGETDVSDT